MRTSTAIYMSIAVLVGGGIGALCRFWVTAGVNMLAPGAFPLGTLLVNILGSFLIGLLAVLLFVYIPFGDLWRGLTITGFLGGFTTFSAFSLETVRLMQNGDVHKTLVYVILSLGCCIVATMLGMYIAYAITGVARS